MFIHLYIVCFCAIVAEVSSCDIDRVALKA